MGVASGVRMNGMAGQAAAGGGCDVDWWDEDKPARSSSLGNEWWSATGDSIGWRGTHLAIVDGNFLDPAFSSGDTWPLRSGLRLPPAADAAKLDVRAVACSNCSSCG